jgi:hypothetical protein
MCLLPEMSFAQWRQTQDGVLTSAFLCTREFFRLVTKQKTGNAVLIGSTAAVFGEAGHADYAAAKAALAYGFTRTLKNELARLAPHTKTYCGGRINCVCPGWTVVPRNEAKLQDAQVVRASPLRWRCRRLRALKTSPTPWSFSPPTNSRATSPVKPSSSPAAWKAARCGNQMRLIQRLPNGTPFRFPTGGGLKPSGDSWHGHLEEPLWLCDLTPMLEGCFAAGFHPIGADTTPIRQRSRRKQPTRLTG